MKKFYTFLFCLSLIASVSSQNLVSNGDLENWDDDTHPTGWTKIENITKEATIVHGGSFSAKHEGGVKDFGQTIPVTPGKTYDLKFWYYSIYADGSDARIWSYWKNGTTSLDDDVSILRPNDYVPVSGEWAEFSARITAPAEATDLYLEVRTYSGSTTYWDDFSLIIDETPPVWAASYPTITNITAYSGDLTVDLDETGTVYFMVLENDVTAPTSEEVKAGVAYGTVAPLYPDNFKYVSANTDQVFIIRGAEPQTDYDIYVVAEDDAGNLQSTPVKFDVTTSNTGIKITNPQAGETYAVGQEVTFEWEAVNVANILIGGYDFIRHDHFLITEDENGDPIPIDASLGTLTFEIPNDAPFDSLAIIMLDASNYALRDSVAPIYITDDVNPTIYELYPENNETDVNAAYTPYIYFVEPVFPFTGKIYIKEESGTLFEEFDIAGSGPGEQLEFIDDSYGIKITPTNPFVAGTTYYIEMDAGVVLDYFGNPFDGIYGSATWSFTIAGTSSVEDDLLNSIKLYPIPASTILTLRYESAINQVEILDLTGSRVYFSKQLNNTEHKIDVSALPAGIYFIKMDTGTKLETRKFVKK